MSDIIFSDQIQPFDQASFKKLFKYILSQFSGRIYCSGRSQALPADAQTSPWHRIDFCISGRKRMIFPTRNGVQDIILLPGDLHFSPANTWKLPQWDQFHEMASVIYEPNDIRFTYIDYHRRSEYYRTHGARIFYQTALPLPLPGRELLSCMVHLTDNEKDLPDLQDLFPVLLRHTCRVLEEDLRIPTGKQKQSFLLIDNYLQENFLNPISRESVAAEFRLTPSYVSRLYTIYNQETFNQRLRSLRLEHAALLLRNTTLSVDEITSYCAYSSSTFLIAAFRRKYGMSPGRYRRKYIDELYAASPFSAEDAEARP